jgi:hypothetical protein
VATCTQATCVYTRPEAGRDWGLAMLVAGAALLVVAVLVLLLALVLRAG